MPLLFRNNKFAKIIWGWGLNLIVVTQASLSPWMLCDLVGYGYLVPALDLVVSYDPLPFVYDENLSP